ncbi:hypothetical protein I4U23_005771 [Adineta vaga]|nr:hypothetical protein I4U23_005771 [Adineta vaga]
MFQRTFIFIVCLLNNIGEQHVIQAIQSLNDFFPFGLGVGDTMMVRNDDESLGPISLPYIFPYFDNNHRQIYQANNGLFSFLSGISTYTPIEFPIGNNQRLITPFWSDIDTRGNTSNSSDNSVYHQVYLRNMTNGNSSNVATEVFNKATQFVRQYFPRESTFEPLMIITGTWYQVGYFPTRIDRLNTLQMVLVTDESRSFAFFLYNDLQWASKNPNGPYGQAGFNAGDGVVSRMLQYSRTSNITLLVNESNVNVPGLFVFRIDTTDIEAGGCSEYESLTHFPVRGPQIGGTTINLQGLCFDSNSTEILCYFGEFGTVRGLVRNQYRASCVSPLAAYTGNIQLNVSFDGGNTSISLGSFTYMPMTNDIWANEDIILRQNGTVTHAVYWNDTIELEWMFSSASLSGLLPNSSINIEYVILKPDEERMSRRQRSLNSDVNIKVDTVIPLASNIQPQLGRQTLQIDLSTIAHQQTRLLPLTDIFIGLIRVAVVSTGAYSGYQMVKNVIKIIEGAPNLNCDVWSNNEPDPSTWNQNLPPCPNTFRQAQVARGQYVPDPACMEQGRSEFNEESASACFRSIRSNEFNAGAQCCYNQAGQIITRGTGAGSDDRYHSDRAFWNHQLHDVLTFISCCKFQSDSEQCNKYLRKRPSRIGSDTMGQFGGA